MASAPPWGDFQVQVASLRHFTVAKLQSIISGWTEQCRVQIAKSGKKQDLIDRMIRTMSDWRETNQHDKWLRAKAVLHQVRETGLYSHYAMPADLTNGYNVNQSYSSPGSHKVNGSIPYPSSSGAGPSQMRYPYGAGSPRRPVSSTNPSTTATKPSIRFKSSPFYKVDQPVSPVMECPESTSAMDRRSQSLSFTLTPDQIAKLQLTSSRYQLRLFCTSSMYHSHHHTGFRTELPCPIEFPATCEVRVNNVQLSANLKGLKRKPGTAPPPDLGKAIRLTSQIPNRVDMVYVNSQQPIQQKKFYMIVYLVEATTVEQLIEKLKKGKYKDEHDIKAKMKQTAIYDDDIVAGPQKMSLKCPLSYSRVETPCRSIQCPHAQCFDATSWFYMMEQTTTWLCPVCDKVLNVEELIIDGYFDRILKETPEAVEDVMVEADGEWHTSDNHYASLGWRAAHPDLIPSKSPPPPKEPERNITSSQNSGNPSDRPRQEVISLDSDSDDEGVVKRELSPINVNTSPPRPQPPIPSSDKTGHVPSVDNPQAKAPSDVIDLTLDSDDEDTTRARNPLTLKRKQGALETNDATMGWKRARYAAPAVSSSATPGMSASYGNGIGDSQSPNERSVNESYLSNPSTSGSASGWGPVHIPTSAPTHPGYQAPYSHPTPLTHGTPVHSQDLNTYYQTYAPPSRPMDLNLPAPPSPTHLAPYHNGPYLPPR